MGTPNYPTSSGAGFYPPVAVHGAPAGSDQRQNLHFQQMATLSTGPGYFFPPNQTNCALCNVAQGQAHSKLCNDVNQLAFQLYLQNRQAQLQPSEQPWPFRPSPGEQQPQSLRTGSDFEMGVNRDNSSWTSSSGGKFELLEASKHPTSDDHDMDNVSSDPGDQPVHNGGRAPMNSNGAEHRGGHEDGPPGVVSNHGEDSATSVIHTCCETLCPTGRFYSTVEDFLCQDYSQTPPEKKPGGGRGGLFQGAMRLLRPKDESEDQNDKERLQKKDTRASLVLASLGKDKEELTKKVNEMQTKLDRHTREASEDLRKKREELQKKDSLIVQLEAELTRHRNAAKSHESTVANLTAKLSEYKAMADKLSGQLSSLEQSNSQAVGGTGAHKDSYAIPPNLVNSVFIVNENAFACAKAFHIFLKERKALRNHEALQNLPAGADERHRKYAVEAYICSRMFAGFENDSYLDSLDCVQASNRYFPANYKDTDFFLQNQDLEIRHQRYLEEYASLQKLGLQGVMDILKTNKAVSTNPFHLFCCRKLVNLMSSSLDAWHEELELIHNGDYSKESLLHHLATNPKYCDRFLKPFVNLAMVTFLLHRLVFQFRPPARIFRYARGTRFDPTYMENAFPIDDDDSDEELVVGLMLVPGFQVGATIVKCTVYLVLSSAVATPGSQ